MPSLSRTAIRLYQRFFQTEAGSVLATDGIDAVLDGNNAVAIAEATVSEHAVLGGSFPGHHADVAWRSEVKESGANVHNGLLAASSAEGPRGILASTIGLTLAGRRATAFLSGPDIAAAQDLLAAAAGRHLPLVLHLVNRATASHGGALGSGHEAFHLSADSGFFTLFASNVQEAVDYSFIAHRVAEQTLTPGLVVMDGEQTALAAQDVRLLSVRQVRAYLGPAGEQVPVPTPAQKLLFGETRRRVPRWHDLDRPVLHGALFGPESFALGAVARRPFFDSYLAESLAESFALFARHTGRQHGPVSVHRLDDAERVLIVQGAAVETARAVADHVRKQYKIRLGVLGVHVVRPFSDVEVVRHLKGKKHVAVLERLDGPPAGDPPLLREVRAALDRALENGHLGTRDRQHDVVLRIDERPKCESVTYGLGGLPLRALDLITLARELGTTERPRVYLGIDFAGVSSAHPKRQVLLDTLRRAYPDVVSLGLRATGVSPDLRPGDALSVAIHRFSAEGHADLAGEVGAVLRQLRGGRVRSRPGLSWHRWASCRVDRVTHATGELQDTGDEMPIDLAVVAAPTVEARMNLAADVRDGGLLLVQTDLPDAELWQSLTPDLQNVIREKTLGVYCLPPLAPTASSERGEKHEPAGPADAELTGEYLLGAVFGSLVSGGLLDQKARKVYAARKQILDDLPAADRDRLTETFQTGFGQVRAAELTDLAAPEPSPTVSVADREAPIAVRHLARGDEHYASLPRFWDQVGVLYRNGETGTLTPDPYFATATIPPLSSTFRDLSQTRTMLPAFDPTLCTGCGKCWTACPDSAIGAVAIGPASLIDTGIRLAGADALRQVSSQLTSRIINQGKRQDTPPPTAGGMFAEAAAWLSEKMALPEDRKLAIEAGLASLNGTLGAFPVAVTDPFFHDAERVKKDGAELLSVVVNPDSCKACGLCTAVCEPGALSAAAQDAERLDEARALWKIWAETPDTSSETIERIAQNPEIGPMAALLLSRYCLLALAGGDSAEPGSGEKIAVRLILAATEYQQQPIVHRFSQDIKQKAEEITGILRETLAVSVPVEDLDALTKVLDRIGTPQLDLATLTGEMKDVIEGHAVDSGDLYRLVELARALTDLHWRVTEGEHGLGRARFGMALAPATAATWAGAFPSNPFQAPVVIDMTGDTAQLAAGLLEGQLGDTAKSVALLRMAALEVEKPVDADWKREALERLSWRDLDDDERRICPPLVLVGSDEILGGRGLSQIAWLLNSGLPIKIVVLAGLDFGLAAEEIVDTSPSALNDPRGNLGLLALAQLDAYVAQTSISEPAHLRQSVREAIRFHGPALIHVHAPSPERHGFAPDRTLEQARLAVASRAFPLFRYDPDDEGVFGTRLDLDGNPAISSNWSSDGSADVLTPAHWAMTEARFNACFRSLTDDDPAPTDLDAWLELGRKARKGKTPTVSVRLGEDEEARYCIDPDFAAVAEDRQRVWRTLQELAGIVTPFTAKLEQEIEQRLAAGHAAELAAQQQASEEQIRALEDTIHNEMASKIRNRLLSLAGYQADQTPPVQNKSE